MSAVRENWDRFALNPRYFPDRLQDCHDLIALLRDRVQIMSEVPPDYRAYGMTPTEFAIYSIIKKKAGVLISRRALMVTIYPDYDCAPQSGRIIDVFLNRVRKAMPRDERIVTVRSAGFRWERTSPTTPGAGA